MTGFLTIPELGPCFLVDNSMIEPITTCPYRAYLTIEKKKKRNREEPALRFGGHIHTALAYRYRMMFYRHSRSWPHINNKQLEGLDFPQTVLDIQLNILSNRFTLTPCEAEDWRHLGFACDVLTHYDEHYSDESLSIASVKSLPFVERPFSIITDAVIEGHRIIYVGKIDLAYRDSKDHLYIMDHKTTSMMGELFWKDFELSEQMHGYCWALSKTPLGCPMGYTVNAIGLRKPTKTGTSIEFERRSFFLRRDALDLWYSNMLEQVSTYLWHHSRNRFPQHHKHCISKYGPCEFIKLCAEHPDSHDDALASNEYKDNVWSPLNK